MALRIRVTRAEVMHTSQLEKLGLSEAGASEDIDTF